MLSQFAEYAAIISTLVFIEGLLATDNALVLAVLVSRLPNRAERKKALFYGIVGAFVFQGLCLLTARWLIAIWQFKALGALYLFYITGSYFVSGAYRVDQGRVQYAGDAVETPFPAGKVAAFWTTVIMVEVTDLAFSVDQVVAAVALSNQLWVVYTGCMLAIIAMRFAASVFLVLVDRHPKLAYTGHLLPAWIGLKLAIKTVEHEPFNLPLHMPTWLFWSIMAGLVLWGLLSKRKVRLPAHDAREPEANASRVDAHVDKKAL